MYEPINYSEKEPVKQDNLLAKISHQIPGAIFQFQQFPDGSSCFPYSTEGIWDIYEVKPEDVLHDATLAYKRITPEFINKVIGSLKYSAENLCKWELDYSVNLPEKGLRWLRGVAQPEQQKDGSIIWYGYVNDVTERKLAARALIHSEQRWQFALEGSGDGIWDWNIPERKIFVSNKWVEKLGYSKSDDIYNPSFWSAKIHEDDRVQFELALQKYLNGETNIFSNEHRVQCEDGTYKWVLHKGKLIEQTPEGKPMRLIGTHSDITLLKEKEFLLQENIKLISEQNSRLSNFAYIISHNLRTHTGNLEVLIDFIENAESEEERNTEFSYLKSVSAQLSETIMHLNEVVSIQTDLNQKLSKVNLYTFAEKVRATLRLDIKAKDVKLENNIASDLEINYSPAYLESILYNLVSNSIKYSSPDRKPIITIESYQIEDYVVLQITDNGIGINLERFSKDLFGMYKTFHGNKNAKGIGLFITKNQIEAMGGKIDVESIEGEGSMFKVFLKV